VQSRHQDPGAVCSGVNNSFFGSPAKFQVNNCKLLRNEAVEAVVPADFIMQILDRASLTNKDSLAINDDSLVIKGLTLDKSDLVGFGIADWRIQENVCGSNRIHVLGEAVRDDRTWPV